MSFNLLQDCNDMDCDMSSTDHAVLMVLCRFANENGGDCFPSTAEIARCSHFATIPVRKALASLQAAGWIKAEQKPGLKRYFTVDAARIRSAVATKAKPLQDLAGGIDQHPRIDQYPPVDQHPRINQYPDPVSINTPTPYQSIPRKEQEKNKEEDTYCDPASFETVSQSASDYGFNLEAEAVQEEKPKKAAKKKAQTHRFDLDSLPEDWRKVAQDMRPDLDADKVFASFRFYWVSGRGEGTLRSDKSWATSWANWLRKEAEGNRRTMASPSAEPVGTNSTDPAELRRQYWALQKQKKEAEEREAALIFGVAA